MFNGLQQISAAAQLVAVHDSARPLITAADATKCFVDAAAIGAAVLGVRSHRVGGRHRCRCARGKESPGWGPPSVPLCSG